VSHAHGYPTTYHVHPPIGDRLQPGGTAAGLTVPALAGPARAELMVTCDCFFRLDDQLIQFDTGVLEIDEDVLDRLWPVHFALIDQIRGHHTVRQLRLAHRGVTPITSISAETHAERIAKAKAAFAVMRYADDVDSKAYDNLVRSALRDVIAGAAA
jgi:hypothetical protein